MAIVNLAADGTINYRASGLNSCLKALVASRLGMAEMDPPEWMAQRFSQGHRLEQRVVDLLVEADPELTIIDGTKDEAIAPIQVGASTFITGHIDRMGAHAYRGPCIVEIKAFAKSTWETWQSRHWDAFPYYAWQTSIYSHGYDGLPVLFVPGLKNLHELVDDDLTGDDRKEAMAAIDDDDIEIIDIDPTWILEPLVPLARIKARVFQVEALAKTGTLPDGDVEGSCPPFDFPCPYWYLHEEDDSITTVDLGDLDETSDALDVSAAVIEYENIRRAEKELKKAKAEVRDQLMAHLDAAPGDKLTGKVIVADHVARFTLGKSKPRKSTAWAKIVAEQLPDFDTSPYETVSDGALNLTIKE